MRVEGMALRSEIRQMLSEAGFTREKIKQLVKDSIDDIVKSQVNQALMERKEKDLADVVSECIDSSLRQIIPKCTESAIKEKLRWLDFNVNVQVSNKAESENDKCPE